MKHGSTCGHFFLPQDFFPNPLSAAFPDPIASSVVNFPPVTPCSIPHIRAILRWFLGMYMSLFSRWCTEGAEVSNKAAETLILQLGVVAPVMSPVRCALGWGCVAPQAWALWCQAQAGEDSLGPIPGSRLDGLLQAPGALLQNICAQNPGFGQLSSHPLTSFSCQAEF